VSYTYYSQDILFVPELFDYNHFVAEYTAHAEMVELVDTPDSKSCISNGVRVRFPLSAPKILASLSKKGLHPLFGNSPKIMYLLTGKA
jgi:hypothetical protein